jgi:hypothetical protein
MGMIRRGSNMPMTSTARVASNVLTPPTGTISIVHLAKVEIIDVSLFGHFTQITQVPNREPVQLKKEDHVSLRLAASAFTR